MAECASGHAPISTPSPEPLLQFTESFNFEMFVQEQLASENPEDIEIDSAHLIGQERDGSVLFSWNHKINTGEMATSVGLCQQNQPSFTLLYQHDGLAVIAAASVNAEHTLLAFTITASSDEGEQIFDTFIAEIKPQSRVFTLHITSSDYRRVQFLQRELSPSKSLISNRTQQQSQLLVVIPGLIICVYKFKMQVVRNGAVIVSQPDNETLTKNFMWYQWDPHKQWLYYARFEASVSQAQASVSGKNSVVLHCYKMSYATPQLVFTISLPLPYSSHMYSATTTYYNSPFAFSIPVEEMNLQVLHRSDGFWCVCLQHCNGVMPNTDNDSNIDSDSPQGLKVDYSIYMIHNGCVLYGQVPLSAFVEEKMLIHFMLISCFVVVYVPGFMLHLINAGPRVDPCHHLTFGHTQSMFSPVLLELKEGQEKTETKDILTSKKVFLSSAVSPTLLGDYDISVIDCNSSAIYQCKLNIPGFFEIFKTCHNPELMEDLLHLMIVGFRQPGTALSMIEHVCQTPMHINDHKLFAEFIVASSYANIYLDCKHHISRQLPLTMSPTFHGKVVKNSDGVKLAYLKITPILHFVKQLLVQSDQKLVAASAEDLINYNPTSDQPFESLCLNAVINQQANPRIDIRTMNASQEEKSASDQSQGSTSVQSSKESMSSKKKGHAPRFGGSSAYAILGKLSHSLSRRTAVNHSQPVSNTKDDKELLLFLDCDEDLLDALTADGSKIRERIFMKISTDLPLRTKNTVYNTIARYYVEVEKQSSTLLRVIWTSLGFSIDNHPLDLPLCHVPTAKEHILYELLEAYHLAHLNVGIPPPSGFHTLYISMAFLCLEGALFLQSLHSKVLTPTRRFVDMLLEDYQEEYTQFVFNILNSFEYRLAEYGLERWNDPTFKLLEASRRTASKSKGH